VSPIAPSPIARGTDQAASGPGTGNADTLVIVPVFNEAAVITDVVIALRRSFDHVLCVDDGSSDQSAVLAAAAGAMVLKHPTNLGQGAALQTGFRFGLGTPVRYFVTFDSDGQHRVEDAVLLVRVARETGVDVVLGSRFLDHSTDVPVLRRGVLRAAVWYTRLTTGLRLTDAHNGLRVLTHETARKLDLRQPGMAHASELLNVVARGGLRYREAPVTVVYSDYSRAKGQSSINAVNILVDLLLARARYAR
jgi:glycosyltransferase involved in cell wall biosynthesis